MAIEKTIEIKTNTKGAEQGFDKLADAIKELNESFNKFSKTTEEGLEDISKTSKNTESGVGRISKGFRGLGIAIKATGIGLFVAAARKLGEVFMENQTVLDTFNTVFEAISIAFNDFVTFVVDNAGQVVDFFKAIFENPVESIKSFGKAIKANIIERLKSALDVLGFLSSAVKKVFSGDFKGALEDVKAAGKESIDVLTGVNNTVDRASEFVEKTANAVKNYATETFKAAKANVELNRTAEIGIAQNRLLLEQFDRQAELQRQIRDDESKTIEERIAANERLGELLAEQEKLMLANADAVVLAAQAQFDKLANDENEIALLEAKAEREGVLAQIAGLRSEQLTNINSLERERLDIIAENLDKEKENAEAQKAIDKAVKDAKIKNAEDVSGAIGQLASVAGEGTAAGKALGVASATIDTYVGANKALAQGGFAGIAQAIAIIATGLVNVKTILSTKVPKPSVGGVTSSGGESTPALPAPPSFNIVGATETSQLADAIGGQTQQPVQAYVVANDVTTAQSLENNIVEGATLG